LVWRSKTEQKKSQENKWLRAVEASMIGAILIPLSFMLFHLVPNLNFTTIALQPYMLFPGLMWAAIRFGQRGFLTSMFGVTAIAVTSIMLKNQPFLSAATPVEQLIALQIFIGIAALTGMILAAVLCERAQIRNELIAAKEAAEEVSRYKSAFLANMSHEIRTPLGAILGFTELMRNSELSASERSKYIDIVNRNGSVLTRLIDDILDLSKVEAGRLEIEEMSFSLQTLIAEVLSLLNVKAQEKGLLLKSKFEESVPDQVVSDPTRLKQVLMNIIGNAIKFTEAGEVQVNIGSKSVKGEPHLQKITFTVKDTGPGISLEQQSRLFQTFTQADSSTTRRFGGTGLGLSLARKLTRALGGDVALGDCTSGNGCTFIATVIVTAEDEAKFFTSVKTAANSQKQQLTDVRVLLVEDSPDNQLLIQRILSSRGAHVETANNGKEGVDRALANGFDLVLMDIQMPVLDGYQATKELRSKGYDKPILALSAHAMKKDRDKSLEVGCNEHLVKPINTEELVSEVARFASV